jgi:hypothetical protein
MDRLPVVAWLIGVLKSTSLVIFLEQASPMQLHHFFISFHAPASIGCPHLNWGRLFCFALLGVWLHINYQQYTLSRPCVIDSMLQVPNWPPEIGARTLPTQQYISIIYTVDVCLKFVLRIFKILKDQLAMHFPLQCIVYVCKLGGQNGCACRTRNIESIMHGLKLSTVFCSHSWIHIFV